jgi:hypothetical protein
MSRIVGSQRLAAVVASALFIVLASVTLAPVAMTQSDPIQIVLLADPVADGPTFLVRIVATNTGGDQSTRNFEIRDRFSGGADMPIYSGFVVLPPGGTRELSFEWTPIQGGSHTLFAAGDEQVAVEVQSAHPPVAAPAPTTGATSGPLVVNTEACLQISGPYESFSSCRTVGSSALDAIPRIIDTANRALIEDSAARGLGADLRDALAGAKRTGDSGLSQLEAALTLAEGPDRDALAGRGAALMTASRDKLVQARQLGEQFQKQLTVAQAALANVHGVSAPVAAESSPARRASNTGPEPLVEALSTWATEQRSAAAGDHANTAALVQIVQEIDLSETDLQGTFDRAQEIVQLLAVTP